MLKYLYEVLVLVLVLVLDMPENDLDLRLRRLLRLLQHLLDGGQEKDTRAEGEGGKLQRFACPQQPVVDAGAQEGAMAETG